MNPLRKDCRNDDMRRLGVNPGGICVLPRGHDGAHADDRGNTWQNVSVQR
jgi:hypothetical protein